MAHEFGHHIHFWIESRLAQKTFTGFELPNGFGRVGSTVDSWLAKWIPRQSALSVYGLTNKYELFAESFASTQFIPRSKWTAHTKRFAKMFDYVTSTEFSDKAEVFDQRTQSKHGWTDAEFEEQVQKLADVYEKIFELDL